MGILTRIAWRNVWRSKRRSFVLIAASGVAVFSYIGAVAYMDGISGQFVDTAMDLEGGEIQVSPQGYHKNPSIHKRISNPALIEEALSRTAARYVPRVTIGGMANSTERAVGVMIYGVDPATEPLITVLHDRIVEGEYFGRDGDSADIVIGAALAERLDLRLGEKMVLMVSDIENDISAGAYRIAGIYRTPNTEYDKSSVFIRLSEAQRMAGYDSAVSLFTMRFDDRSKVEEVAAGLRSALAGDGVEVLTWKDRFPMLKLIEESYDYASFILVFVLFLGVAFTIINSYLMVIFERIHELGVMMATGVKPHQIRRLIYLEALFTVMIGMAVGLAASMLMIWYWSAVGLDLSNFSDSLGQMGLATKIYPMLKMRRLVIGFTFILVIVVLAVLYPARKASRFGVVEAINYV